jgi:hypothetical protein
LCCCNLKFELENEQNISKVKLPCWLSLKPIQHSNSNLFGKDIVVFRFIIE